MLGTGRRDAKRAWSKTAAAWKGQAAPPDVSDLRPPIEELKKQLDALAAEREAAIHACAAPETEEAQRARYLGTFRIEAAKLSNIGPARCAVLRSWGIDTAADIDQAKIAEIPGFGRNLTDRLVIWREMKETAFVPSTAAIIDPHEVQRIDRRLAARRTKLMKELREKITEVDRRMSDYVKGRDVLWVKVESRIRGGSHTDNSSIRLDSGLLRVGDFSNNPGRSLRRARPIADVPNSPESVTLFS